MATTTTTIAGAIFNLRNDSSTACQQHLYSPQFALSFPIRSSSSHFLKKISGTTITVVNDSGFAVWQGISGNPYVNISGFKLPQGTSRAFQVPENWSGRIWGRTGCRFNKSGGWSCATGDCGTGEVECKGRNYTQPVTVAELNMTMGDDYYDVSLRSCPVEATP
ncbi:G-type lectin S-receptor-like serine/threonine-protein kinase [Tanacetum coccineum]